MHLDVVVADLVSAAADTVSLTLRDPDHGSLPAWRPGAHIEVRLPSGLVRHYSLCSDPDDLASYRIGVLQVAGGRGGSAEVHALAVGTTLQISPPRNTFGLVDADEHVLLAGGIGVTPILPMARELGRRGQPARVVYTARSRERMAFVEELADLPGVDVRFVAEDEVGRPDLAAILDEARPAAVYACGPAGMLDAVVREAVEAPPAGGLHVERFVVSEPVDGPGVDHEFDVVLARSGITVHVPVDVTILAAVRGAGVVVDSSCEQGICGTCQTVVLDGAVDHRDEVLTDEERAGGGLIQVCVSRAAGDRLVLDL